MPNTFTQLWQCWPLQIKHQWNWRWYFSPQRLRHFTIQCFANKEWLSGFPLKFSLQPAWPQVTNIHKHHCGCFFRVGPSLPVLPDPWLLLQGDFAVRQQLLSDCVDSDGHDQPAKATNAVILLEITTWSSSTLSGLNSTLDWTQKTRRFDFYIVIFLMCLIYFGSCPASNTIFTARAATSARNCAWHIQNGTSE